MIKQPMSSTAAKALGEVVACTLMMGSGLKNEESLQVNLVGKDGIRNVMAITDSGKGLLKLLHVCHTHFVTLNKLVTFYQHHDSMIL